MLFLFSRVLHGELKIEIFVAFKTGSITDEWSETHVN